MPATIYTLGTRPIEGTKWLPMLRFERLADTLALEDVDAVVFSSQEAIRHAEAIDASWKRLPAIVVGEKSADAIRRAGGRVLATAEGSGVSLAKLLCARFRDYRLLYLRPKKVAFALAEALEDCGMRIKEQILYRTVCRTYAVPDAPEEGSVLIFSSPSTIRCFLKNFEWKSSYRAVAIGKRTAAAFPEGIAYTLSELPSFESALQKAQELLRSRNGIL